MTKLLSYSVLPLTNDPYQVFTADVAPDGTPPQGRMCHRGGEEGAACHPVPAEQGS